MTLIRPFLIVLYLLICLAYFAFASLSPDFTDIQTNFSSKYFGEGTQLLVRNGTLSAHLYIRKPLQQGLRAILDVYLRATNAKEFRHLFKQNINACDLVAAAKQTILKRLFDSILKYGNFSPLCPVNNGYYYLNNWKMETFPAVAFQGDYRISAYAYFGKYRSKREDFVLNCQAYAVVNSK